MEIPSHIQPFAYSPDRDSLQNKANLAGYIPIIGTVSGLFRIMVAGGLIAAHLAETPSDWSWLKGQLLRGALEVIPLVGTSLAVIDIYHYFAYQDCYS